MSESMTGSGAAFDPALQAQYDNPALVPEHPGNIAGWARDAAAYREHGGRLDVPYGASPRARYDRFGPDDAPVAIFIHGGYWQKLDKSFFSHCAAGLVAHGVAVAVVGYELCPQVTLRQIVQQIRAACRVLRPVLAFGHSAGGHLSAMLLAMGDVPAALPISGVFDVTPLRHTRIGDALALAEGEARALSPMFMPPPAGRLHAVVGGAESDAFRAQTRDIAARWSGTSEEWPGANHFTVLAPLADPNGRMVRQAVALARGRPAGG